MRALDLVQLKRDILSSPIGLGISMMFAYALLCALVMAGSVHAILEDGKHFLMTHRVELELQPAPFIVLCHEQLGCSALPIAKFIPQPAYLDRVISFTPASVKSAWPGSTAVPQAP